MPGTIADPDLLKSLAEPLRMQLRVALAAAALPGAAVPAILELLDVGLLVALVAALARVGTASVAGEEQRGRLARHGLAAAGLLVAAPLLVWIARHPSSRIHQLFARWDHLAFALFAGCALGPLPLAARRWVLSALSLGMLWEYSGPLAVLLVVGAGLVGFGALLPAAGRRPWTAAVVQSLILLSVYAYSWRMRGTNLLQALEVNGLAFFVFLRHISFVVDTCKGATPSLGSYLCYISFYPGASGPLGSAEVYHEFARRNLTGRPNHDHRLAARRIIEGALMLWAAARIPVSLDSLLASASTASLWLNGLGLWVHIALEAMGFWAMIEGTALFYGFRLQPNFKGVLTRQNPSELWWAWRGSLTNWLVRYVYGPLGASRRHQSLNIVAAFGASMLWHWLAVPFLSAHVSWRNLVPISAWFVLNGACVIAHVHWQRRRLRVLPEATPRPLRRATKILLILCLGASCATLPQFQGQLVGRFPGFVRMLLGVGGW